MVRITVPVDSVDERDVSEDLAGIDVACGVCRGTSVNSCGSRCDPWSSSLLGTLGVIVSAVLGAPLVWGYFIEAD